MVNNLNELIQNYNLDLSQCRSLTLISSESCNLNCSYCIMAKSIHAKNKKIETEKIKQSFNDGTYLKNIKDICTKYNIDPLGVESLDLWGQEPTLTLNEFGNSFKDLYNFFPNLSFLFFSTNGVAFPERIVNLTKTIDAIVTKPFDFAFQFSYDGYEATKNLRGIAPEIIINNIEKVILSLNEIKYNNIKIHISFHNVLSSDLINKFGLNSTENDSEFLEYLNELSSLSLHFHYLNKNPAIHVSDIFVPGIEAPYNATAEEGKRLYNFFRKADILGKNLDINWWKHLLFKYNEHLVKDSSTDSLDIFDALTINKLSENYADLVQQLSKGTGCGSNYYNLKVRYDGTIIHCQNAIALLNPVEYEDRTGLNYDLHRELIKHNYYPNLLKEEDELAVQKALLRGKLFKNSSFVFFVSEILNLLVLLADSNQIDISYKDNPTKMFKHAARLAVSFMCWDNNLNITGSGFGKLIGELRFYCNGFLDLVDEKKDEYIQERHERNSNND